MNSVRNNILKGFPKVLSSRYYCQPLRPAGLTLPAFGHSHTSKFLSTQTTLSASRRRVIFPEGLGKPIAPYSPGVLINDTLYVSGQLGVDDKYELVDGIEAQARQALKNVSLIVKGAGGSLDNVVRVTIYLVDMKDFGEVNKVYREFFPKYLPARVCFQCSALPIKGGLVEIDAVAVMGEITDQ